VSYDYLLDPSGEAVRAYASKAASDGVITYKISDNHDPIQANWVRRVYEFLGRVLTVQFTEDSQSPEYTVSVENLKFQGAFDSGVKDYERTNANANGDLTWKSAHNEAQYGGALDQMFVVQAIAKSLGITMPFNEPFNPQYSRLDSILSFNDYNVTRRSIIFRSDDISALQFLYGKRSTDQITGLKAEHQQRIKEDLLIGTEGVADTFKLVAKGQIYTNKDAIKADGIGNDGNPIIWHNDYNIPSITNFNPEEGDKILINKDLFIPYSPISPGQKLPKKTNPSTQPFWTRAYKKAKLIKTQEFLRRIKSIDFGVAYPSPSSNLWESDHNLILNGTGKLMINANGTGGSLGPYGDDVSVTGQIVAFLDYGTPNTPLDGSVFGFM
jgi:hypothetical protein